MRMDWIDETIKDFGKGMGIEGLSLNESGVLSLAFEKMGTLFIERAEDVMLVYLVKGIPRYDPGIFKKALELCHYRQGLPLEINPGFKEENRFVFLTRVPENDFTLPQLEKTVDLLVQLHEKISEVSG